MIKGTLTLFGLLAGLWVGVAVAGPVDTPIPTNPCAVPVGALKLALVANESGTDFGGPSCGGVGAACAETLIVCTHLGPTGEPPMDIGVELFDSAGAVIPSVGTRCGIGPGATTSFVTLGTMPAPYFGSLPLATGPQVPLGSLRILSTNPKRLGCDVTLIDRSNVTPVGFITATKDVTVTKSNKGQKGD